MALDFVAGCLGGCAGVLVGHPFDTIKVRLQTQDYRNPQYKGTLDCLVTTIRKESVSGLYKGMSSPMAGVAMVNAIVFGVYGNIQRRLPEPEALSSHFVAGATAGFCQSFICSPMELVKTRIQLQNDSKLYKSPFDCLNKIWKSEGLRGVFKGLGITVAREIPGFGTYFLSYEIMTQSSQKDSPPLSTWQMLLAGGMAGTISWVITYPIDVIKSRIQVDGMSGVRKYTGVIDCFRQSVTSEGYGCLTRGLTSTILRAFPTNAACFTVVTWVLRWMGQDEASPSYQVMTDYQIKREQLPARVGAILIGFEKHEQYFIKMFNWKNLFFNDVTVNCLVHTQVVHGSSQITKRELNQESAFILSDFSQFLHGDDLDERPSLPPQQDIEIKLNDENTGLGAELCDSPELVDPN